MANRDLPGLERGEKRAMISYEELVPGYEFPPASYELSPSLISKYLKAVEGSGDEFVPPLAIAAYAMTAVSGSLSLPPGTIHASQELEFFKLVPVGAVVNCQAKVARKLARAKVHMLVLELDVFDQNKEGVQAGKATIVLPVQGANA